jgi:CDP-4-dehydro-6-deoxyglucose reductase, E3
VGSLTFEDKPVKIAPGETVLTALLAAGVDLPNSCRAGACQTCLVQAVEGNPPAVSQQGLPAALKAQSYLMACVCLPQEPMRIVRADGAGTRVWVSVRGIERLSPTVVRLRLEPEAPFLYRSGQFLALEAPDGTVRHYSIGRPPRCIRSPRGSCFYEDIEPDQPLVLAGTGTGLAPLWGILRDALRRGHHGPIRLYHGARDETAYITPDICAVSPRRVKTFGQARAISPRPLSKANYNPRRPRSSFAAIRISSAV